MSVAGLHSDYVGKHGQLAIGEMTIPVLIIDARVVWNRTDLRVTPLGGHGNQWVSADRVTDLSTPG
jgi:hypothetical protein